MKTLIKSKKILTKGVATLLIGTSLFFVGCGNKIAVQEDQNEDFVYVDPTATTNEVKNDIYVARFNGEYYNFVSEEYFRELSDQALNNVTNMLLGVKGITPVGTKTGKFLPEYFPDMLEAIAFTESSFRISKSDGSPLLSKDGAVGMCQILPKSVETLNKWLENTMELNVKYSIEDANDPEKALEMCLLLNIRNCKNVAKEGKDIYSKAGIDFNFPNQEKILYACYFYGEGNVKSAAANGTLVDTYLNPNWKDGNGINYVYRVLNNKKDLMQKYEKLNNAVDKAYINEADKKK